MRWIGRGNNLADGDYRGRRPVADTVARVTQELAKRLGADPHLDPRRPQPVRDELLVHLSEAASVTVRFVAKSPRRRGAETVTLRGRAGANAVFFDGALAHHKRLGLGGYTAYFTATASGRTSPVSRLSFKVTGG